MQAQAGNHQEGGQNRMGQDKQSAMPTAALSELDAISSLTASLNRIADAINATAAATELLARATAGEFDDGDANQPQRDLAGRVIG